MLAIGLGVALILGTDLTSQALRAELRQASQALIGHADAEVFAFSEKGFSSEMVDTIKKLPQVAVAAPVVSKRLTGQVGGATQTFVLLGIDPVAEQMLHPLTLDQGRLLAADDKAAVLLDRKWASDHQLGVGSKLSLFTALGPDTYTVKGLLKDSAFVQSAFGAVVFVPLRTAQKAFRLGARVTEVSVGLKSAASYPGFRQDLRLAAVDEYTVRDNHAFVSAQRDPLADIQPVLIFFSLLALGIGLFLIYNNLAVTVLESRREIGLLRAAGATPDWVRRLFLTQALLLGLLGTVLGLVLGVLVSLGLITYLRGASGQEGLSFTFDAPGFLAVAALGLVATMVCGLLPARRASRVAPLEAIRLQNPFVVERSRRRTTVFGLTVYVAALLLLLATVRNDPAGGSLSDAQLVAAAAGVVLILVGTLALIPALIPPLTAVLSRPFRLLAPGETMLARNALERRPNRSALTIAGLVVSTALVVAVSGLSQGALEAGQQWVDGLFVSDHLIVSPVHQGEAVRREIGKVMGVDATTAINFLSLRSGDRTLSLAAIDPLEYASRGRLQFVPGSTSSPFTELEEGRALFLPRRLAAARDLKVGDEVRLTAASGEPQYRVAAIVAHSLPAPGGDETALISLANARQDFGAEGFNILQVIPSPSAPAGFDGALRDAAQRYGMQLESVADVRAGVRRGLDSLLLLLTGVGLVGIILGLMSVVETILLNISESSRELALLRAVGATRGQVRRIILSQSGLFGLSGAVIGSLVGLILVAVMIRAGASLGFEPSYQAPWAVIGSVVLVTLAASVLAAVVPARRAASASVVQALRYE